MSNEIKYIENKLHGFTTEHPSFGAIRVNKVFDLNKNMFCTNVDHDTFIELSIHHADGRTDSNGCAHYIKSAPIITVQLTYIQWAELVSSFGVGSGVPCTLADINCKRISKPDYVKPINDTFKEDIEKNVKDVIDISVYDAKDMLQKHLDNGTKIGKKELQDIIRKLDVAENIKHNIKYAVTKIERLAESIVKEAELTADAKISLFKDAVANQVLGLSSDNMSLLDTKPSHNFED